MEKTTKIIRELQDPTTQTEVQAFMGICNVFRWLVPNVLRVAELLNKKFRKDQPKFFTELSLQEK